MGADVAQPVGTRRNCSLSLIPPIILSRNDRGGHVIALLLSLVLAVQGIPVQAQQGGKVTGVLKDSAGKPVAGIRMAAIARPDSLAEAVTSAAMSSLSETDADGRYTLENIPPGKYYIAAGRLDLQTYYPGTPDMATAKELAITPGANLAGIDFTLGNSSFGRAATIGSFGLAAPPAVAVPLRVTIEGGGRVPLSGAGKITSVRLDMNGSAITVPVTGTVVNVPGPQTTAYRVTVENLPETYAVKSITYGSTDLMTNTLRLTPANFPSSGTSIVQLGNATLQMLPLIGTPTTAGATTTTVAQWAQLFQNQIQLQVNGNALTAGVMLSTSQPAVTPPSMLSITLAPTAPKPTSGVRVTGRANFGGARTIYLSGIPGAVYSDGTFEVYGVPPGRHTIVTRYNPTGLQPLAASIVVGNRDIDGITLEETALLPINAWEPTPPRTAGERPAGNIPLAKVTGTLVEEISKEPIAEGTVVLKTNGYYSASFPVDADGHFELPPLLPGTYDFEVQIFGHSNVKRSIEIDDRDMKLEILSRKLY